ncbi:MAG: prepilin-type N-terminal cleavage/methylation domain-containing protein [Planctomycetota bacterium]|nr:prepilin-type N-terminal cleavage/methylation domain-containing protein [Planctomycetota bacterium]
MNRARKAFTLVELVIVVVIAGVVAAIAVPRVASFRERSVRAQLTANQRLLQQAFDHYIVEHDGRSPLHGTAGASESDSVLIMKRLTLTTDAQGTPGAGPFGPYLHSVPVNPLTLCADIRVVGGPGDCFGWIYRPALQIIEPAKTAARHGSAGHGVAPVQVGGEVKVGDEVSVGSEAMSVGK